MCPYPEWEFSRKKQNNEFQPRTSDEGPEAEYRYSSTISLTSVLDGVGGKSKGLFNLEKETRYPFLSRETDHQGRAGRVRKISPLPVFDLPNVEPVASRYTDCAIPPHR
jgi:hypothetical protein